jgi:hypothetical protein
MTLSMFDFDATRGPADKGRARLRVGRISGSTKPNTSHLQRVLMIGNVMVPIHFVAIVILGVAFSTQVK